MVLLYFDLDSFLAIDVFDFRFLAELLGFSVRAHIYTQIPPRVRDHSALATGLAQAPQSRIQKSTLRLGRDSWLVWPLAF